VLTERWQRQLPYSFLRKKIPTARLLPSVVIPHRLTARAPPASSSSVLFRLQSCALNPAAAPSPSHLASPPLPPPRLPSRIHKRTPVREGEVTYIAGGRRSGGRLLAWPRPRRRTRAGNSGEDARRWSSCRTAGFALWGAVASSRRCVDLAASEEKESYQKSKLSSPSLHQRACGGNRQSRASRAAAPGCGRAEHSSTWGRHGHAPWKDGGSQERSWRDPARRRRASPSGCRVASASAWPSTARSRARALVRLLGQHLRWRVWTLDSRRRR
jgi:hypothetical protein